MTFASMGGGLPAELQIGGAFGRWLYSHIAWLRTIKEKIEYKG
jgi:hypothetical protein